MYPYSKMGLTIIRDGLGKPFAVCPAGDDDLKLHIKLGSEAVYLMFISKLICDHL